MPTLRSVADVVRVSTEFAGCKDSDTYAQDLSLAALLARTMPTSGIDHALLVPYTLATKASLELLPLVSVAGPKQTESETSQ